MVKPLKEEIPNVPYRSVKRQHLWRSFFKKMFSVHTNRKETILILSQIDPIVSFRDDTENSLGKADE